MTDTEIIIFTIIDSDREEADDIFYHTVPKKLKGLYMIAVNKIKNMEDFSDKIESMNLFANCPEEFVKGIKHAKLDSVEIYY